jgi:putative nucleotidyltransferase with HDIG domain
MQDSNTSTEKTIGHPILGAIGVLVVCAILNRTSALFQAPEGTALIFPAAAASALGGILYRWWGVAGAFLGFMVSPWGLATSPLRAAAFAAIAALHAAIPAAAKIEPEGSTKKRSRRVLGFGAILNTFIAAVVATPLTLSLDTPKQLFSEGFLVFSSWFFGDMTAIFLLAVPVLLFAVPELLLDKIHRGFLKQWAHRWRLNFVLAGFVLLVLVLMETAGAFGWTSIHWLAPLLLIPILVCAVHGAVGAGLIANGFIGVLYLVQVLRLSHPFDQPDLYREVFPCYANLIVFTIAAVITGFYSGRSRALVVELANSRSQLQQSFESVVTALAAAIEAKDQSTEGHVQRVARISVAVGKRLGLYGERLELLRYAAILHDVGKIGVPEEILNKTQPLTPQDRALLQRHVDIGVDILRNVEILSPAVPFIRYHQERWDGDIAGHYPGYFGLREDEIPLEARIIAVVDAYDAMTSHRPYRQALNSTEALAELAAQAGKQFDPVVVDALVDVIDERLMDESGTRFPVLGVRVPGWARGEQ